ncbi:MAG TPA: hypothetical protein ENH23_05365 [candidate division Zixibacteria bacterium]|nr:hypothetical protein [candidate division Zixibacteria bacterium]
MEEGTYIVSIKVSEKLIEMLFTRGEKPTIIFSKIIQRMASEMEIDELLDFARGESPISELQKEKKSKPAVVWKTTYKQWDKSIFQKYIDVLLKRAEKDAESADLISFLVAYIDTGPRPTSDELRDARGFGPSDKWFEELRVLKSRLTIAAKHMGLPRFFPRAYGSGMKRRHPIDNEFYDMLSQWHLDNKGVADQYRQLASPRAADYTA